ncbi:hypothetical protein AVEN_41876-1 [Araneus ventricosus]|uniref:Uncharacterized protein n=1 Tax=Araneus ventricosus TaxID=182803 RepID=A0A4Y2ACG0_ARAVE|nr:hypothetical protein AVEN_41876-1 [Araneus ventricosus]
MFLIPFCQAMSMWQELMIREKCLSSVDKIDQDNLDIITDDEESDDACTSIEHGRVAFYENIQEETAGTIEIPKQKNAVEYISALIVHRNFHQLLNYFMDMISGKSPWNISR